ncbi:HDOD domain-containing protein [Halopseudomonas nanhaiensis]|uniref:HDOD domain-containing protein n=1 Tax=Halopseudomonas nanhaiensis TaxID=2830842 RepID=UPI001CBB1720|nr:HDOD domain-containing protein [Halopseudomonas nanhaiensis]UAW97635.1 HDOD domain-containing protein [Halopseudomonas nanhaiensis]
MQASTAEHPADDIQRAFLGLLLGVHSPLPLALNRFELAAIRRLDSLADSDLNDHALVPRLPAILPRLMTSFRDPATSSRELADLVGRDLVSVSEVMRLANSPFYRRSSEAKTLEQAVLVLGQRGLRQMMANVMLKPVYNSQRGHFSTIAAPLLWEQAEKTAAVNAALARANDETDEFSAYLAGLCSNLGLLIGARVLDGLFDGSETPSSELFREQWLQAARRLTAAVARAWDFPDATQQALAGLQKQSGVRLPAPSQQLYSAERFSQYHGLLSRGRLPGGVDMAFSQMAPAEHFSIAMQTLARFERRD